MLPTEMVFFHASIPTIVFKLLIVSLSNFNMTFVTIYLLKVLAGKGSLNETNFQYVGGQDVESG